MCFWGTEPISSTYSGPDNLKDTGNSEKMIKAQPGLSRSSLSGRETDACLDDFSRVCESAVRKRFWGVKGNMKIRSRAILSSEGGKEDFTEEVIL